ncbi:MAG: energy-coupling factor ABC transporter permease, partial [Actinobacteria bacterium]|nr:energy-coupling factor ABC transporter permease [Actinomycetota bacterium]
LTLGANVLNMAVIMPFVGLWAYRAVAGRSPLTSRRRLVAAGVAGYIGINAAGLATAIELGIQPLIAHTADGTPLYSPYGLAQTIPAMALAHLTIAGAAETILTVGVFAYLAHADVRRLVPNHPGIPMTAADAPVRQPGRVGPGRITPGRVAIGFVAAMVALAPLGLLAPGGAFGEDAPEDLDLGSLGLSSIPDGLNRFSGFWSHTLLGDYGFADGQNAVLGYWLSALVGIAVIGAVIYLVARSAAAIGHRSGRPGAGSDPTGVDAPAAI